MNYIIFSPLEQFEFITIGLIPEFGISHINSIVWFNAIDQAVLVQQLISHNYIQSLNKTPAIMVEGMFNIGIIEILEYIRNYKEVYFNVVNNAFLEAGVIEPGTTIAQFRTGNTLTLYWLNVYNSAMIVFVVYVLCFIYFNTIGKNTHFLNIWNYLIDLFFSFLLQTFMSLADRRLLKFFPAFCVFFIVIFLSNLTALVPLSFCLTSNLWLTLTLSLSVWVSVTVLAIIVRGFGFFTGFVPANVPAALKGFITIIEIISYLARAISLGVRIFANMLAGHSLVHILSDLVETCIISFNHISLKVFGIFPALILTFILFIEFGICFLQALVFVILTAIYLKEAFGFSSH
jgi:F-type H+-transporting ATPase subunit a